MKLWLKTIINTGSTDFFIKPCRMEQKRAVAAWGGKLMEEESNLFLTVDKAVSPLSSHLTCTQHWGEGWGQVIIHIWQMSKQIRVSDSAKPTLSALRSGSNLALTQVPLRLSHLWVAKTWGLYHSVEDLGSLWKTANANTVKVFKKSLDSVVWAELGRVESESSPAVFSSDSCPC